MRGDQQFKFQKFEFNILLAEGIKSIFRHLKLFEET